MASKVEARQIVLPGKGICHSDLPVPSAWPLFSKNELGVIFENTQDAIWSVDINRRFITCNSFLRNIFRQIRGIEIQPGMSHEEIDYEDREFWRNAYDRAFDGEKVIVERQYQDATGSVAVQFLLNPVR